MISARPTNAAPIVDLLVEVRGRRRKPSVYAPAIDQLLRANPPLTYQQIAQRLPGIRPISLRACLSRHNGTWFKCLPGERWTFQEYPREKDTLLLQRGKS